MHGSEGRDKLAEVGVLLRRGVLRQGGGPGDPRNGLAGCPTGGATLSCEIPAHGMRGATPRSCFVRGFWLGLTPPNLQPPSWPPGGSQGAKVGLLGKPSAPSFEWHLLHTPGNTCRGAVQGKARFLSSYSTPACISEPKFSFSILPGNCT